MTDRDPAQQALDVAFSRVFGTNDELRTPEQRVVLARLREIAKPNMHHWIPGQADDALGFAQGRLRMWFEIDNRVSPQPETVRDLLGLPAESGEDDHDS